MDKVLNGFYIKIHKKYFQRYHLNLNGYEHIMLE